MFIQNGLDLDFDDSSILRRLFEGNESENRMWTSHAWEMEIMFAIGHLA